MLGKGIEFKIYSIAIQGLYSTLIDLKYQSVKTTIGMSFKSPSFDNSMPFHATCATQSSI
jgi:hypothetical protein